MSARAFLAFVMLAALAAPAGVGAASYAGYAETGFDYTNKSECCEDAVAMAQEDSALNCERVGGYADFRRNSARGRCDWATRRAGSGRSVFGCTATASVSCR